MLYGGISSAGAVNLIAKAPIDTIKGSLQLCYGTWTERALNAEMERHLAGEDGGGNTRNG